MLQPWPVEQSDLVLCTAADIPLRIETLAATCIHWSADDWNSVQDLSSHDAGLGVHFTDLPTQALAAGGRITFTFHWLEADRREGADFVVLIDPS